MFHRRYKNVSQRRYSNVTYVVPCDVSGLTSRCRSLRKSRVSPAIRTHIGGDTVILAGYTSQAIRPQTSQAIHRRDLHTGKMGNNHVSPAKHELIHMRYCVTYET